MPAALYKGLSSPGSELPNPIHTGMGFSISTSDQVRAHFLCDSCEQMFSAKGENFVMKVFAKSEGQFWLQDELVRIGCIRSNPEDDFYVIDCADSSSPLADSLAYFAASVFWRSSAGAWYISGGRRRRKLIPTDLGPYQEGFRQYLLGEGSFPKEAALLVRCAIEKDPRVPLAFPQTFRKKGTSLLPHIFQIPGILFEMFVSRNLHRGLHEFSINAGDKRVVIMQPLHQSSLYEDALAQQMDSVDLGKLAKLMKDGAG